jgi:hypothetical protein
MKTTIVKKRSSITVQYRIQGKQFRIFTGVTVQESEWNERSKVVNSKNESYILLNQRISKSRELVESFLYELLKTNKVYDHLELKQYIKKYFDVKRNEKNEHDLTSAFGLFIEKKTLSYSPLTIRAYRNTLAHLNDYSKNKPIAFNKMTKEWFEGFTRFLKIVKKHSPSMRGKQVKTIKAVLNFAFEEGLHNETRYRLVRKENEHSPNVYLTEEEISELYHIQTELPGERELIDAFVFICLTGVRYSDYHTLTKDNFKQEGKHCFLNYRQEKTNTRVSVPIIYELACDIIEKYNYHLPKFSNAYMNRRLKQICQKYNLLDNEILLSKEQLSGVFKKRQLISIHTGRRSFATNQYLKSVPINLIMAATGHQSEKAFRLYIKADEFERAKKLTRYSDY